MDIGRVIRDAWGTTWHYRFLWVLALFAGGAAGVSVNGRQNFNWRLSRPPVERVSPGMPAEVTRYAALAEQWALAHVGLLIAAGLVAAALALALMVVWLIAQGGMAEATVELGEGHQTSFGRAWRAGMHLFWRYAGLWLALAVVAFAIAAVVGSGVAVAAGIGTLTGSQAATVATVLLVALPVVAVAIAVGVGVNIVATFAQRAIAAEDEGPIAALRTGWHVLRSHLAESLLTWVVSLGLAIASGIAIGLALLLVAGILFALGAGLWAMAGMGPAVVIYASLGGLAVLALALLLGAVANTFFWNYWTLAYLRLSDRHQGAAA